MSPGRNIRLFKNDFLEKMTYVPPLLPIVVWGPLVVYWFAAGLYSGALGLLFSSMLMLAGLFIWTVSEYFLHRFIFHFKPHGQLQERISFLIHGIHHEDPSDERRLLMPPLAGAVIAVVFYALFTGVLGPTLVKPFFAGFISGYLVYDYTHFAVHFWRPESALMKRLKHNHMLHHFTTPNKRFGVSSTFWDSVFHTQG